VICGKGASGIMQHYSPARLSKPLLRVGERGAGEFREIEWEEAIATAVDWLSRIRADDPRKLAFFTGRDQSQSLTGFWATQFGTPNFAAHGGFCSVNMAAAGMYTLGGSFWEFGEPDWERTRLFLMFGVAEDHDSNPIKLALSRLRRRGAKFVSVNPVRTGYSAIADEWIGIRPGTDGLFVLSLIHELLHADKVDLEYLGRYTNAAWLVIQAPGTADDGLFARNEAASLWCSMAQASWRAACRLGSRRGSSARRGCRTGAARCRCFSWSPSAISIRATHRKRWGRSVASRPRRSAGSPARSPPPRSANRSKSRWRGPTGPGASTNRCAAGRCRRSMRCAAISAHSNGFQTCRALHLLQMLLGTIDVPGGWRYKSPYPKPAPPGPNRPASRARSPPARRSLARRSATYCRPRI